MTVAKSFDKPAILERECREHLHSLAPPVRAGVRQVQV